MGSKRSGQVPPQLMRAAARFADWRRNRVIGARIPKALWASAVRLAGQFGISRTATCLKLDYYELKRHLESVAPPAMQTSTSLAKQTPAFVEWPASSFPTPAECVIELENASGSKMRVQFKGSHAPDLVALSGTFWNTQQ
jgi:hypothetical protein